MENKKKNKQQINIELDADVSSGEYANFVVVTHSPAEFVLDFTRILPGVPKAKVHSRIIMAPPHAKTFLKALNDNVSKFESKHGEIKLPNNVNPYLKTSNGPTTAFFNIYSTSSFLFGVPHTFLPHNTYAIFLIFRCITIIITRPLRCYDGVLVQVWRKTLFKVFRRGL